MDHGVSYERNDKDLAIVKAMVVLGHNQENISRYLDISDDTLRLHYAKEIANAKNEAELTLLARFTQFMNSEDENIALNASKFVAGRRFKWIEDKGVDTDAQKSIFDAIVEAAAAQLLAKKEKEHEY